MGRLSAHTINDDEYEQLRLKKELEDLKRERDSEKKDMWVIWFLAIWLLPLLGMFIVQGDDLPKTAGPDWPVVGRMSHLGHVVSQRATRYFPLA